MFKRTLIVAALAAATASSAFAASSVEIYSEAWLNVYDGDHAFQTDTAAIFAGDQKLDNGLTAFGVLRAAIDDGYASGEDGFKVQRMEIGLKGDFGAAKFGKVRDVHVENIDWYLAGSGQVVGNTVEAGSNGSGNGYFHGVRYDGNFGGLTAAASYTEKSSQWHNGGHRSESGLTSALLAYDFGFAAIRGSFATGNVTSATSWDTGAGVNGTSYAIGASTKFAGVSFDVAYFDNDWDSVAPKTLKRSPVMDQQAYKVGLGYAFGPVNLSGYWAHQDENKAKVNAKDDYDTIGVKAVYNVGKSLNVYARYLKDTGTDTGYNGYYKEGAVRLGSTFSW
jgi:hypothetical protein